MELNMTWLIIKLLKRKIKKAEKVKSKNGCIVEHAYNNMIKNFNDTIMYLKANRNDC